MFGSKKKREKAATPPAHEPQRKEMPSTVARRNPNLPIVANAPIVLQEGEVCHFAEYAERQITKEEIIGYSGERGTGAPMIRSVTESFPGTLYITNKRVVFAAYKNGFAIPLPKLTSIKRNSEAASPHLETMYHASILGDPLLYGGISRIVLKNL